MEQDVKDDKRREFERLAWIEEERAKHAKREQEAREERERKEIEEQEARLGAQYPEIKEWFCVSVRGYDSYDGGRGPGDYCYFSVTGAVSVVVRDSGDVIIKGPASQMAIISHDTIKSVNVSPTGARDWGVREGSRWGAHSKSSGDRGRSREQQSSDYSARVHRSNRIDNTNSDLLTIAGVVGVGMLLD